MFVIKSDIVWFLIILHVFNCERRIQNGTEVKSDKPYVVYLVKAPISNAAYDSWLCGGALVTSYYVVTSAACIKDVDFLYVIAGYKKYVVDKEIDNDPCTKEMKKKVIYTCYPATYKLNYDRADKWADVDIGVAKVESAYNFLDETYTKLCSYLPKVIPVSYEAKNHAVGADAIVLGWGHKSLWRQVTDDKNHNQATLNYAPVVIMDKKLCKKEYADVGDMPAVIDKYMICTNGAPGTMDENGEEIKTEDIEIVRCSKRKSLGYNPEEVEECEEEEEDNFRFDTRREIKESNYSSNESTIEIRNKTILNNNRAVTNRTEASINRTVSSNTTSISNKTGVFKTTVRASRRNGFCQNDHGGPLVAWGGTHELLIGVASVFKVTEDNECTGPYLYTSTQCNGAFLDCILTQHTLKISPDDGADNDTRRAFCRKSPREKGYATVERHISWLYHPAGAADHEKHLSHGRNEPNANEQATRTNEKIVNENNMNPVNNMNSANNMNPPSNTNPVNTMNSENNMDPPNNMNPVNNMNPANNMNPPNNMNPVNNMNAANNMNPPNNMNPVSNMNSANNMNPPNNMNPVNNMNAANNMNPPNNMNPVNNMNAANNMNPPNNMNPVNNMNAVYDSHPPIRRNPLKDKSSVYVKDAINERYG